MQEHEYLALAAQAIELPLVKLIAGQPNGPWATPPHFYVDGGRVFISLGARVSSQIGVGTLLGRDLFLSIPDGSELLNAFKTTPLRGIEILDSVRFIANFGAGLTFTLMAGSILRIRPARVQSNVKIFTHDNKFILSAQPFLTLPICTKS
jgi:hypothetical protein